MTSEVNETGLPLTSNMEEVTSKVGVKRQSMGDDDLSKSIQKKQKIQKSKKERNKKNKKTKKTKKAKKNKKTKKNKKKQN